jgi:hypothetical protein
MSTWFKKHRGIICSWIFLFISRFPSFFDPLWYHDEVYYMAVGQHLSRGGLLYVDIWDHKPPFLYLIYSGFHSIFNTQIWPLKVFNWMLGCAAVYLTFWLSKHVFKLSDVAQKVVLVLSTLCFAMFFDMTIFNAENLFVPLLLAGFAAVFIFIQKRISSQNGGSIFLIFGAICWSLAVFTKIPALAEVMMLVAVLWISWFKQQEILLTQTGFIQKIKEFILTNKVLLGLGVIVSSVIVPFILGAIYFAFNGYLGDFMFAVFGYNQSYIDTNSHPILFGMPISVSGLMLRFFLVVIWFILSTYLYLRNHNTIIQTLTQTGLSTPFYIFSNWLSASIFGVFISERPYAHYLIEVLPALCILGGYIIHWIFEKDIYKNLKVGYATASLVVIHLILTSFSGGSFSAFGAFTVQQYWLGFGQVILRQKSLASWQANYNSDHFERLEKLSAMVQNYSDKSDYIYVVGNMPELYVSTQRLNGYKVVTDYHNYGSRDANNYLGVEIEAVYTKLVEKHVKLIVLDKNSAKAEGFAKLLPKNYRVVDRYGDQYQVWQTLD